MGRLIHTNDLHNEVMFNKKDWGIFATTIDNLIEGVVSQVPTAEAISKADYETRLKADLKAILVELQLEVHELENPYPHDCDDLLLLAQHNAFYDAKSTIEDLVDEKIKED